MFIAAELITETAQTLTPNHSFRLELYSNGALLPLAAGLDCYNLNCEILPGKILAATGRTATYGIGIGLGAVQADAATPINLNTADLAQLKIKISNNKILDQADLKRNFSLRIRISDKVIDLHLGRPDVRVYWEGRGEFVIPLGEHVA